MKVSPVVCIRCRQRYSEQDHECLEEWTLEELMESGPGPWVQCACGNHWCEIHSMHAFECVCPPIEEWKVSPYSYRIRK